MPIKMFDPFSFEAILKQKGESEPLEHDQFLVLWHKWDETKDNDIFEELFRRNMRLMYKFAKNASERFGIELTDAYQVATFDMIRSIRQFRPEFGQKFSTLAGSAIKREIKAEVNSSRLMPVEKDTVKKIKKLEEVFERLTKEKGRRPNSEEIALELGVKPKDVELLERISSQRKITSLDTPLDDGDGFIGDNIPCPENGSRALSAELASQILAVSRGMTEREKVIFVHRILARVLERKPTHLETIGQMFGRDRKHASVWERKLVLRLKRDFSSLYSGLQ